MKLKLTIFLAACLMAAGCTNESDDCTCDGKQCGDDGCGGSCGFCPGGYQCVDGLCSNAQCIPQCDGKQCGSDGCGGACGTCPQGTICEHLSGICTTFTCIPDCSGKQCGNDGCGGSCGTCASGTTCQHGVCTSISTPCIPDCYQKICGDDGCGGSCGTCYGVTTCIQGQCLPSCLPNCDGKQCGDDGCGGLCGTCPSGTNCYHGTCTSACVPECISRVCGDDGCGGSCGICAPNTACHEETGQCLAFRVKGRLIMETQTVYYDAYQLPKLDKKVDKPAAKIPVSLRNGNGTEIAHTTTASDGSFELTLNRLPTTSDWLSIVPTWSVANKTKLAILMASTNTPYNVWSWSIQLTDYAKTNDLGNLGDIRITIKQGSGALFIYQQLVNAYEELLTNGFVNELGSLKSMGAIWKQGMYWPECGSCFIDLPVEAGNLKQTFDTQMRIGGLSDEESAWGYPTLLHEFGHYVLKLRRDDSNGGTHYMSGTSEPKLAWSEGFATFYYLMVQSLRDKAPATQYWRVLQSGSYWLDYAHLYESSAFGSILVPRPKLNDAKGMKQYLAEAWITYVLWNYWDGKEVKDPSSPADGIQLGTAAIFNALASDRYLKPYGYNTKDADDNYRTVIDVDFVDFVDALLCPLLDKGDTSTADKIMDFLITEGFPYDKSPVCTK